MKETTPQTPTERELAGIWARVLGLRVLDREQDFFRSGGDSLLAAMVVVGVRRKMAVEITPQLVFTWPVLADLAHQVDLMRFGGESRPT